MYSKEEFSSGCTSTSCYGCGKLILDRFLLVVLDKNWHVHCVRCHQCGETLDNKCFFRDGNIFCREDFYRLYGPRCAGCHEGISPTDLVRRARDKTFHLACFTCAICRKQLSTGEELFILDRDRFICKDDFNTIRSQDYGFSDDEDDIEDKMGSPSLTPSCVTPLPASLPLLPSPEATKLTENNNNIEVSSHLLTKIKTEDGEFPDVDLGEAGEDKLEDENRSPDEDSTGKRRGPRTTIKAKQLDILKTAFQQTPKPTRHIREQLAKETGLSMRVIQVWFQNKRSKERRMKQLTSGMLHRGFFGGPFGDYGFGPRFPGHPDFFQGGPMPFLQAHPGLPGLEQPLPMSGCHMSGDPFAGGLVEKDMSDLPFSMAGMSGDSMDGFMDMQRRQEYGCGVDMSHQQLDWQGGGWIKKSKL